MRKEKNLIKELWFYAICFLLMMGCTPQSDDEDEPDIDPIEGEYRLDQIEVSDLSGSEAAPIYQPRGIGGGGAMSGFSQSPFSSLWFVGTDMGTLFRSIDWGESWKPVFHKETIFASDLTYSPGIGFFSDGKSVVHAPGGLNPVISQDHGKTWNSTNLSLESGEYIEDWYSDTFDDNSLYALTTKALWLTKDKGQSWQKIYSSAPQGMHIDYLNSSTTPSEESEEVQADGQSFDRVIYLSDTDGIYQSINLGSTWNQIYKTTGSLAIRNFAAGRDESGLTLAFGDNQGSLACSNVESYRSGWGNNAIESHYSHCGYLWVSSQNEQTDKFIFTRTDQKVGDHLEMAENDSSTIVVTGSTHWIRQYGTKVWLSEDAGLSFNKIFQQLDWDVTPFKPWSSSLMDYSAVALDIGWYDDGYVSFSMNQRNSHEFGGTGFFFLHTSRNKGAYWDAPFTNYAGTSSPSKSDSWVSTGLEVTTVYRLKFHPNNPNLSYAAMADVSGMVSQDGGESFQLTTTNHNSIYDYAFDYYDDRTVFAVSGSEHDFPMSWHANWTKATGGVFKSSDRGHSWSRLTPSSTDFDRQFLSIAFDSDSRILYAGSQSLGIARSTDEGSSWSYFNDGLPTGNLIIPQIEVDPTNGDVYALVSGNAPDFTNHSETGIYRLEKGSSSWELLRGTVHRPEGVAGELWYYPTAFAIDLNPAGDRSTLYLVDYENNRNWLASGVWKSSDAGENWYRVQQYTHPLGITIDSNDPSRLYVSGLHQLDGNWGQGGALYSSDAGQTWKENKNIPYQKNGRTVAIDPNHPDNVFYTFFGSGLLYGKRPE